MGRQATRCSSRGLLLVEAVLSAVVITTGLIFISRGLSGQLRAIRTIEAYDMLCSLAGGKLLELEHDQLARGGAGAPMQGVFPEPFADYDWTLLATPRLGAADLKDQQGAALTSDVVLTVEHRGAAASAVALRAIWPSAWVSQ